MRVIRRTPILSSWWQRIKAMPLPVTEESIPLRILVQSLAVAGIIAMDVAAADVTDVTPMSYWAVPLSITGAIVSWYRRRYRNIPIKFCIALGMLLTLGAFLGRLVTESYDTRLALAGLLVQLQVLHSFDLPRRKDLGYSMVIGLILLGVAATVSQTFSFAPLLIVFLIIALPTLVMDYRSRLGFQQSKLAKRHLKPWFGPELSFKRFSLFLAIVLGFGLAIFAFLPRFPGYQLRNFPISAPIEFQGKFDGSQVNNPGYGIGEDGEGSGAGVGQGVVSGPGQVDETFYYGFNTTINQNLRGEMRSQVVLRVRSQAAGFWRVMAFDRYTGQGWEVSRNDEARTLYRHPWSYQFILPRARTASETRDIVQTYTVMSLLPSLIPALAHPRELYFPLKQIAIDSESSLRSPIELLEGLTYTVISEVPYRDRTQLKQAPTTYPQDVQDYYLQIPEPIAAKVRQKTQEILDQAETPITAPSEQVLYLAQYLKQNYAMQPDLPFFDEDEDLVEAFLFRYQGGYPDHFSTTLTMMLRSIGIPARLVAGFAPGDFNPFTGLYVVRNTDAYAITEVYFPDHGWFAFDPIPGHELIPPSIEENQTFTVLRQFWNWVAGWLPSPVTGFFNRIGQAIVWGLAWAISLFSRGWFGVLSGLLLLTSIGFAGWLTWSGWRNWRYYRWLKRLPPMEGLYQQMLDWLAGRGYRKGAAQTPLEYALQVGEHHPPRYAETIEDISQAYVRWRYGGEQVSYSSLQQRFQYLKQRSARKAFKLPLKKTKP